MIKIELVVTAVVSFFIGMIIAVFLWVPYNFERKGYQCLYYAEDPQKCVDIVIKGREELN